MIINLRNLHSTRTTFPQKLLAVEMTHCPAGQGAQKLPFKALGMNKERCASEPQAHTSRWDRGTGATDRNCGDSTTSLTVPQLGKIAWAPCRVRKSPVVTGSFYLDSSHCCNEAPIGTCQILCIFSSAGSWPLTVSLYSSSPEGSSPHDVGERECLGTQGTWYHKKSSQMFSENSPITTLLELEPKSQLC